MSHSSSLQRLGSGVLKVTIAALAIVGIVKLQQPQLSQLSAREVASAEDQRQEALRLSLARRSPTFGFDNLMADWAFLNLIQYDGDSATRKAVGYDLAPKYFDLMTRLDPRFVDSYVFLSGIMSYQMGKPEEAIALMDRGTTALTPKDHPKSFLVWRLKGLDQLLMVNDLQASQFSYDQAGDWALLSSDPDTRQVGPIFKQTAEFIRTDPNNKQMLLWSWSSIYDQAVMTRDETTKAKARAKLLEIGAIERKDDKNNIYFTLPPKPKATPSANPSVKPNNSAKPTESPNATDSAKPTDSDKPTDSAKPTESPKPAESPKPDESPSPSPQATESATPATPKPKPTN